MSDVEQRLQEFSNEPKSRGVFTEEVTFKWLKLVYLQFEKANMAKKGKQREAIDQTIDFLKFVRINVDRLMPGCSQESLDEIKQRLIEELKLK